MEVLVQFDTQPSNSWAQLKMLKVKHRHPSEVESFVKVHKLNFNYFVVKKRILIFQVRPFRDKVYI